MGSEVSGWMGDLGNMGVWKGSGEGLWWGRMLAKRFIGK